MQLYNETFFNRRNWILEKLDELDLTLEETLCILYIDYYNEFNRVCDIHAIAIKLKKTDIEIDEIFDKLIQKNYIKVEFKDRRMIYNLEGLFHIKEDATPIDKIQFQTLFNIFEQEFKRTLSQKETELISEWMTRYDNKLILHALRNASAYEKMNFSYIEKILVSKQD